jgi:hypothetical protein
MNTGDIPSKLIGMLDLLCLCSGMTHRYISLSQQKNMFLALKMIAGRDKDSATRSMKNQIRHLTLFASSLHHRNK